MQKPPPVHTWLARALGWGAAGCVTVLVLAGIFRCMIFSDLFHDIEHRRLGTVQRFTQAPPMTVIQQLQVYFRSDDQQLLDHPLFSYRERLHYREVKQVLQGVQTVFAWCVVGFIGLTTGFLYRTRRAPGWPLAPIANTCKRVAVILFGVIAICALFALNFEAHFLRFHTLLFTTKNWLLPSSSATIQLFPPQYFFDFLLVYAILVLCTATLLVILAHYTLTLAPEWPGGEISP